jgi:hypothetical protein
MPYGAAASTGAYSGFRAANGLSLIASASSTVIPVSAQRRTVSASIGEPGETGQGRSPSVAGEMRRPTAVKPARAAMVTRSGGETPSSVRCSSPVTLVTANAPRYELTR